MIRFKKLTRDFEISEKGLAKTPSNREYEETTRTKYYKVWSQENLDDVANFLDNAHEFKKVKTKYAKEGWDAVSLHGYGPNPEDILKPGVLKSSVNVDTKLQWTIL